MLNSGVHELSSESAEFEVPTDHTFSSTVLSVFGVEHITQPDPIFIFVKCGFKYQPDKIPVKVALR